LLIAPNCCIEIVAENGADMTIKNENDETCYSLAATLGNKAGRLTSIMHLAGDIPAV
jgi:ankyrin repeat protein